MNSDVDECSHIFQYGVIAGFETVTVSCLQIHELEALFMWVVSNIGNLVTWMKTRFAFLTLVRSRRNTLIAIALFTVFFIWILSRFMPHHRPGQLPDSPAYDKVCLSDVLSKWKQGVADDDVMITHNPLEKLESPFLAFVGNGNIGVVASDNAYLHLALRQPSMNWLKLPFSPLVTARPANLWKPIEAGVIDFKQGMVHQFQTYSFSHGCVIIENIMYAHRSQPSVLVQEVVVINHGHAGIQVLLKHEGANSWKGSTTKSLSFERTMDPSKAHYTVSHGKIPHVDTSEPDINVTVATSRVPSEMTVQAQSSGILRHLTVVRTSSVFGREAAKPVKRVKEIEQLQEEAKKELKALVSLDKPESLRTSHALAWTELLKTGLFVDPHHDADTPSGLEVNSTLYYVLSSFPTPASSSSSQTQKQEMEKLLHIPDHCFGGPPTMHSASLWPMPRTEAGITKMAALWERLLEQNGCSALVRAGATGIVQAMTLSFGGLQFSAGHFEFAANPASLHTTITFRRIHLYEDMDIFLSVTVNEDNGHAEKLIVKPVKGGKTPLYACEAGCQYDPVEVGETEVTFPVRMTKPVTPLLYISHNKSELLELRKHVFIKDAHEESLKNRHVHHRSGLPAKFWVTIAFLIVGFHLYLAKLIYSECFKEKDIVRSKIYMS
ncbi:unnamed protein product [Porites lobata]|uniref:Uncharacterized protein n=1 Tax=Porites lobata TaxID=104759 RepID=A0ABN8QQ65_9CNID|nr:unnamed protein product [Porites lobata]